MPSIVVGVDETPSAAAAARFAVDAFDAAATLARAGSTLREALGAVGDGDDAWADDDRSVATAVILLQAELVLARARLLAERAEGREAIGGAAEAVVRGVRQVVGELRVRTHIGRMDAEDATADAIAEIERLETDLRMTVQRVERRARTTWDDVRTLATMVVDDVVEVVRTVVATAWDDMPAPDGDGSRR